MTAVKSRSVSAVDQDADADVDLLRRLKTVEQLAHRHPNPIPYGRRNLFDNSDDAIQQGPIMAPTTITAWLTSDRWQLVLSNQGTWSDGYWAPGTNDIPGMPRMQKAYMYCNGADAAPGGPDLIRWSQQFEGARLQHLMYGTANALPVTFSGWFFPSITGTYYVELRHNGAGRSATIPLSLTGGQWNYRAVTFPPNTADLIANTTAEGLSFRLCLGAGANFTSGTYGSGWQSVDANRYPGQTNLASAINQYMVRSAWQLEVGSIATPFEIRPSMETFRDCARYYQVLQYFKMTGPKGAGVNAVPDRMGAPLPVQMRAAPALSILNGPVAIYDGTTSGSFTGIGTNYSTPLIIEFNGTGCTFASGTQYPYTTYVGGSWAIVADARI